MPYSNPEDQKAAARRHYEANKDVYKARAVAHKRAQRAAIRAVIHRHKDRPCTDCKVKYPYYVMQFDHQEDKLFNIGSFAREHTSIPMVLDEIAKCELVCANCHAERTHRRGSGEI